LNYGYLVIYQNEKGKMIYRANKHKPVHQKGDHTSMGWVVVDIQRLYNGKIYSSMEYSDKLTRKEKLRDIICLFDKPDIKRFFELIILGIVLFFCVKFL